VVLFCLIKEESKPNVIYCFAVAIVKFLCNSKVLSYCFGNRRVEKSSSISAVFRKNNRLLSLSIIGFSGCKTRRRSDRQIEVEEDFTFPGVSYICLDVFKYQPKYIKDQTINVLDTISIYSGSPDERIISGLKQMKGILNND
jgi:hypothetical protein